MIKIVDIHSWLGRQKVLDGVDMEINKGEVVALIGKSGVGKSVLLKHIVGLMKPKKGAIYIDGENIVKCRGRKLERLREKFGFLFQGGALFDSYTVYDNVAFPLREKTNMSEEGIRERVMYELEQVGLAGFEHKYPAELSGGMRKRAALARCMVTDPEIMFFDEPTTGLDPLTANSINMLIKKTYERTHFTGIIVSHEIPEVFALVHKVAMLWEGKIIFYGTPKEIMKCKDTRVKNFIQAAIESCKMKINNGEETYGG
ncbi:ABC transport system ATP-binding protein [Thermosulfidibacter takaii ABI70S6]|uniref:ABC transport system ATP-binding protein n=1 Tax=Thermosulfidibacter takaii (strain DSM 17441 / JCM 13301 / NBRC 103674 / ABI70S6) TaxID=1298851 RepID=A0A0S3QSC4_THET7|nr:ABC transporter ATP-binding protein [Thermosulfidibacter takaii]BAT71243.1 ABC transport system ATP-binding protein [Thermosulfidibacter takaii ABI70S6]